jgi:hypothetical protein
MRDESGRVINYRKHRKATFQFLIVECTRKPMETPSENRKMVSYIDTPFFDFFSDEEMAPFPWVHGHFRKPETPENFRPLSDATNQRGSHP